MMFLAASFIYILIELSGPLQGIEEHFAADRSVPEWAKSAVWYQIFPERFRNGDSTNDPQPKDLVGSWPHTATPGWQVSKWTGDWYELQPWERADNNGFYYHAQERRYGGDLQGVLDKLDYLKDLGITAIYFNPLFESPSLHKYDATFYHHIDNNFGPEPEGDRKIWGAEDPSNPATWQWTAADKLFLKLIKEAHRRGIKVVIDGVFNHVGMTFWALEDVRKKQQASRYKDWFTVLQWDDPATKADEFKYQGWNNVKELPELREDENGLVQGPREHVKAVVSRWMDPNADGNPEDGIDGWRLDVAEKVKLAFWREFRTWVRSINPEAYITGEVWWEDWENDKMYNAAPWLQGDAFDAVMNYRWAREALRFFAGKKTKIAVTEFNQRLTALRQDYPPDVSYVLMNLLDSHDTDRLGSHIVNCDLNFDKRVGAVDNKEYDIRKPGEAEIKTQKLMALFQMTYVGAPVVYYGDEAGMWGGDDPDERKPMLWSDLTYDPEKSDPFNRKRPVDENKFNLELFQWYSKLIKIRNDREPLRTGTFEPVVVLDEKDIFAFKRVGKGGTVVVALNNSQSSQTVSVPVSYAGQRTSVVELLSEKSYIINKNTVTLTLNAKSGVILQ